MLVNNLVTHTAAVGVIAFVTMFPTPEHLFDAFETPTPTIQFSDDADILVFDTPVVADANHTIRAPFPLACAERDHPDKDTINSCATQLVGYLDGKDTTIPESGLIRVSLDPETEQARRALIEICRLRWTMTDPPSDPAIERSCESL